MAITQIGAYHKDSYSAATQQGHMITHDVYSRGQGKVCVIIQELPGIGQETLSLADRFVERGYLVVLPHLFGPLGKIRTGGNLLQVFCMRREFTLFSKRKTSPIVDWLKQLCAHLKDKHQVRGVATIGMCLTGNFALSLMAEDAVLAGFASQPSMPILKQKALHMSDQDIQDIKHKLDQVGPMHCGRFEKDKLCTNQKFDLLRDTFNDGKERLIFHEMPGEGHAILTLDFVDEEGHPTKRALDDVMDYFDERLGAPKP